MARNYELEVLRVGPDGQVTLVELLLRGDLDTGFGGAETGTTWRLDGVNLATNPVVRVADITATTFSGPVNLPSAVHFRVAGVDYVIPRGGIDPGAVSAVTNIVQGSPLSTNFLGSTGTLTGATVRQTKGLLVNKDFGGNITGLETGTFVLLDDDARIEFGAGNETGQAPVLLAGSTGNVLEVDQTLAGSGQMQLVRVNVTMLNGSTANFQAILNDRGTLLTTLVPLEGSINLDRIATVNTITTLANTLEGRRWSDFGFGANLRLQTLDGGDNTNFGGFDNEKVLGRAGKDTLFGAHGDDVLLGGRGADMLFGGLNNDTLKGGDGADVMFGGSGDDILKGGRGSDTLHDGAGRDTLVGEGGADVFVLRADRKRDFVKDYTDGVDKLDLGLRFNALTITTIAPGKVSIVHDGDILIVTDSAGTLTAADLTRSDFIF